MPTKKPSNTTKKTTSTRKKSTTASSTRKRTTTRKKPTTKRQKPKGELGKKIILKIISIVKDERTPQVIGIFFWLFAAFCLVAFVSYIFTGEADQDFVHQSAWDILFSSGTIVNNWLGRVGTFLGHIFIYKSFGLASFLITIPLIATGYKLIFKKKALQLFPIFVYTFFGLMLVSAILGFIFADFRFPFGGNFGKYLTKSLHSLVGSIGTVLTLLALCYIVLRYVFNIGRFEEYQWEWPSLNMSLPSLPKWERAEYEKEETSKPPSKETKSTRTKKTETQSLDVEEIIARGRQVELDFDKKQKKERARARKGNKKTPPPEPSEILLDIVKPPTSNLLDDDDDITKSDLIVGDGPYDPKLDLSKYDHPPLDLLEFYGSELMGDDDIQYNREELENNKIQIVETLNNYNIEISKIWATPGPTVTLYEIVPAPGVRISKIRNLEDDIALSLAALGIRIIAPMPGKGTIGIEVPNQDKSIVSLRGLLASDRFQKNKMGLPIALGKTISNENFVTDLAKMPHLLLAGATGQGKSVCLNSILVSLLYKMHPAELKFVMIDPKKVELSLYNIIERHFLAKLPGEEEAIVTDTKKVISTLNALCIEMDARYDLLKRAHVRNIREYNAKFTQRKLNPEKGHRYLPYFVLVIDEFADLIMTAGKEVELPIARLAQLARAIGIHLVIATQRPTVNIITGTIKANFPCRIAFRVTSKIDSRTILDTGGAEQLIGRGDMLLSQGGIMTRLQGAFVDTPEVDKITDFISGQPGYSDAFYLPEYRDEESAIGGGSGAIDFDDMFEDAARLVVSSQSGSTSGIQRKLKLGYNRAGRIMDQLEKVGIVGPQNGSKPREVYVLDEYELEQVLQRIGK